jgi:hypothetical protein
MACTLTAFSHTATLDGSRTTRRTIRVDWTKDTNSGKSDSTRCDGEQAPITWANKDCSALLSPAGGFNGNGSPVTLGTEADAADLRPRWPMVLFSIYFRFMIITQTSIEKIWTFSNFAGPRRSTINIAKTFFHPPALIE